MKSAAASAVASSSRELRSALCSLPSTGLALEVFDSKFHLVDALAEQQQERLMSVEWLVVQKRELLDLQEMFRVSDQVETKCVKPFQRVTSTCMIRINSPQHGIHVRSCQRLSAPVRMFLR